MAERESIVTRVQKLLAVAMNEGATEAERTLAQERADALMAQHMIEQHELAKDDVRRSEVTSTTWRFNFEREFGTQMELLLKAVVKHTTCRAEVTYDYLKDDNGKITANRKVVVVGTPENMAYAEQLWMIVFTELVRNMFPKWDSSKSLDENMYNFVKAGTRWQDIHEVVWDNAPHLINNPYPTAHEFSWGVVNGDYAGDGGKLKRAYHRELAARGEPKQSHTSRHSAYRSSYVAAYIDTIRMRLHKMEHDAKKSSTQSNRPNDPTTSKYALAVIDSQAETDRKFYELYPDQHPDVIRARQQEIMERLAEERRKEAEEERKRFEAMTPKQRDEYLAKEQRKRERQEAANEKYLNEQDRKNHDHAGASHGRRVAEKVNLNNTKNVSGSGRKELD